MKPLNAINKVATLGAGSSSATSGMEIGLTFLVFVFGGVGLDKWLGTRPVFTIGLFVFAALGTGLKYYYQYIHAMDIEIERRRASLQSVGNDTGQVDAGQVDAGHDDTTEPAPASHDPKVEA